MRPMLTASADEAVPSSAWTRVAVHFSTEMRAVLAHTKVPMRSDEREPIGPRMPTVRRSDRAGRRWSPLRPFSVEKRAPRRRTSRMSSPLRSAERTLN